MNRETKHPKEDYLVVPTTCRNGVNLNDAISTRENRRLSKIGKFFLPVLDANESTAQYGVL